MLKTHTEEGFFITLYGISFSNITAKIPTDNAGEIDCKDVLGISKQNLCDIFTSAVNWNPLVLTHKYFLCD